MKKKLLDRLGKEWLFLNGGTGTLLQARGLKGGELPETWNLRRPEDIMAIHGAYLEAGCDIFNTNTFGANRLKYGEDLEKIVTAGVSLAIEARRRAGREDDAYVALDIGPTGRLLAPMGDLGFEEAVEIFGEVVRIGAAAGADLVLIETISDSYEAKAAVLAAKENCELPVVVTVTFDGSGKLLTGGTPDSIASMLEGLRVDALGVNCGMGPDQMLPIVKRLTQICSVPVIVNPNAGLPRSEGGRTVYDVQPEDFARSMEEIAALGIQAAGGCCGTTPDHIRCMIERVRRLPFRPQTRKNRTVVSSFSLTVEIGGAPVIIGERINPTGKKKLKEALRSRDLDYILQEGLSQEESGAQILDVNVGLPEIDEPAMMAEVLTRLQGICALPLQIDTSDPRALERGLRLYNGKPMINSVNGKKESMDTVFPLVKKYGGAVVALTLDESGIPSTAQGRLDIARRIVEEAARYGIPAHDILVDTLAMTISSDTKSALVTLETLRRVREELHVHTILGVSNISFGLPQRMLVSSTFFTMALHDGLSCAIINPGNEDMMASYRAFKALTDQDPRCEAYIDAYAASPGRVWGGAAGIGVGASAGAGAAFAAGAGSGAVAGGGSAGGAGDGFAAGAGASAGAAASLGAAVTPGAAASSGAAVTPGAAASADAVERNEFARSIERGLTERAGELAAERLKVLAPLELIEQELIPALDRVGKGYEKGTVFLPQLLRSAEAAGAAFDVVRGALQGQAAASKGRLILATVKGDIHDIGKNIVKVMLENYGYDVIDLGKDVPPEVIVETAVKEDIKLVGLSALMTTTVVSMEETIKLLKEKKPDVKTVVGGAVMTQEYADSIGADCYAKDAMATVHYAGEVFGPGK